MSNEVCIKVLKEFCNGEPGEPLSAPVVALINAMAGIMYWPFDFGEDDGNSVELYFIRGTVAGAVKCQADFFIRKGGDV